MFSSININGCHLSNILISKFSTSQIFLKVIPKNLKKFSKSSQDWLTRHLNDPYVKLARQNQYRARSAFKLLDIDEKNKLFKPGQIVVECGASPGAWTQVVVETINSNKIIANKPIGKVIAIDINNIYPVEGAIMMPFSDFTSQKTQQLILEELKGNEVDVILSDMAPCASGNKELDHTVIIDLSLAALKFAVDNSKNGSSFLCKIWEGYRTQELLKEVEKYYQTCKRVKPGASRAESSEIFVLGKNFKK